ncbi:MAG: glycosyltransferase [Actinomycetota bacterium]
MQEPRETPIDGGEAVSPIERPVVLHLIATLELGGTEHQLVQFIVRSSAPLSHVVALFFDQGPLRDQLPRPPVIIGSTWGGRARRYLGLVPAVWRLRRAIKVLGVDLVHAHLDHSEIIAALAIPRHLPLVASRRGRNDRFHNSSVLRMAQAFAHRRVNLLVCNSNDLAEITAREDRWPPPSRTIYNGVDLDHFRPVEMPSFDQPTIAFVANLIAYKRHGLFLEALRIVADKTPQVRALLVGDGPEREAVLGLVTALDLEENVELCGQVRDTRPFVARAHLVMLTSEHEGVPNSLLEGMAMGRPVVATRIGGIPELVRHGIDGMLCGSDAGEIAEATLALLNDPVRHSRMSKAAIDRAAGFGWERVVEQTEQMYAEVLTGHKKRRLWSLARDRGPRNRL